MIVRLLNFFCFAVAALTCLALYHVSEETRIAHAQLIQTRQDIGKQQQAMRVLQTDWERVSDPARIQQLAAAKLGISDTPTMSLASLELLPRRGETKDVQQASVETAVHPADPRLHYASLHTSE